MKIRNLYSIYLLIFVSCSLWGQVQKTNSLEELANRQIDASGSVVAFSTFVDGIDTFYVKDLRNQHTYNFQGIKLETILNSRFAILENKQQKECFILNLKLQKIDTITNMKVISYISNTDELVYNDLIRNAVVIKKLDLGSERIIEDVVLYEFRPSDNTLFYINSKMNFGIFNTTKNNLKTVTVPNISKVSIKKILYPEEGLNCYLMGTTKKTLKIFKFETDGVSEVFSRYLYDFSDNTAIDTSFYKVRLLKNERIALGVKVVHDTQSAISSDAEIWYGELKEQVPTLDYKNKASSQLALINLKNKSWVSYHRKNSWMEYKIDEHEQVYGYEVYGNNDQTKLFPDISVYKYDDLGKPSAFVGRLNGNNRSVFSFINIPFLIYFYNNNWYYFNDQEQTRHHINVESDGNFYDDQSEYYKFTSDSSSGIPIMFDNEQLFFNDVEDIWIYNSSDNKLYRDTKGREEGRRYRLDKCNYRSNNKQWSWYPVNEIKNRDGLVLNWTSNMHKTQGISLWIPGKGTETILQDDAQYSSILRSDNFITYIKQKASQPPTLYLFDLKNKEEKIIYQSNTNDADASQVMSDYFSWKNKNGELRGAVVRFPKNYSSTQKYPVIVNIYEKKYPTQHRYVSPYKYNSTTINFREYINEGYFVIEPDIFYQIGNPGISAVKCVNDVLDELASIFPIDEDRIGIIGHSFGGYQTNFIITQTTRFKAAVSNAGVSDLVNRYFMYGKEARRPEMWRAESQQARMAKSFFDVPENYIANSPIHHAKNITTPLMLISGKEDYTVNWEQSMYMFNALKRLSKDVNLILYSGEKHEILNPENRLDVSRKIKSYFDYHLKDGELPDWIKKGLP